MKRTETISIIQCDMCLKNINGPVYCEIVVNDISFDFHRSCFESFDSVTNFLTTCVNTDIAFTIKEINRRAE